MHFAAMSRKAQAKNKGKKPREEDALLQVKPSGSDEGGGADGDCFLICSSCRREIEVGMLWKVDVQDEQCLHNVVTSATSAIP